MMRRALVLVLAVLLAATIWGCSSNRDSASVSTTDDTLENAATLGVGNCLTCHLPGVATTWLMGVHGNPDLSPVAITDPDCLVCHDQLGDGGQLSAATGGAEENRSLVSCESCHGGGQFHSGVGPLPYVKPDSARCGQCHNASFPHGFAPEGAGIVEDFEASPHTRSLNDHVFAEEGSTDVRARCSKCHSDEGAKLYLDVDGDYDFLSATLPNTVAPVSDANAISCRTCHSPHDEKSLLESETTGTLGVVLRSSEFNTCTNCHQLLDDAGDKIIAYHDPAANSHGALGEIITDTHFAEPGNFDGAARGVNQNDIAGYAMDFADERACRNCHNPHNADTTLNEQWAESGHANKAAEAAWAHYNWTEVSGAVRNDGSATSDRTSCQRCHTTRGLIKVLTETGGDTTAYVPFMDYDPSYKPEMLHCNGCHSNNLGGLRAVGPITADYTDAPTLYPDALGSNICLACHTGRESGETVKASTADFSDAGFINSHYLTAGGTVFARTGYEYDVDGDPATDDYANVPFFAHDMIGTPGEPGTGDKGPCIGCHLSSPESHLFLPVTVDEGTGLIGEITSTVCAECHAGQFELTPAELNEEKEHYLESLEVLAAQLGAAGHPFLGGYPYFAAGDWTNGGTVDGMDLMGAAFNFNLLEHDPGGYAHNRFYAKRLIYDSIDYIDNILFDESVGAAIDALVTSGDLDAGVAEVAKAYLDGDSGTAGVQRP